MPAKSTSSRNTSAAWPAQLTESADLPSDPQEAWDNLQEPLAAKGWVAFDFSPGTDADGFAVRQETATDLGLETMTDLAAVADQLVWGLAPGCPENPVCGPGLNEVYGIDISALDVETLAPCSTEMADCPQQRGRRRRPGLHHAAGHRQLQLRAAR